MPSVSPDDVDIDFIRAAGLWSPFVRESSVAASTLGGLDKGGGPMDWTMTRSILPVRVVPISSNYPLAVHARNLLQQPEQPPQLPLL